MLFIFIYAVVFHFFKTSAKTTTVSTLKEKYSINIDMDNFEAWSTRAWTDVFLQIYKVIILLLAVKFLIIHMKSSIV